MKHEKMWEVFQSARNGSEKYLICEGTPDDFYDRERELPSFVYQFSQNFSFLQSKCETILN